MATATIRGVTVTQYPVAGLPLPLWLPAPLKQALIGTGQPYQNPGIARADPMWNVQHETANTGYDANALMHSRYLDQGAPDDAGNPQQLSYHFTTDDHEYYQKITVAIVTWQAADGPGAGNMNGVSNEMCVNSNGNMALARRNSEWLTAGLLVAFRRPATASTRHWDWNSPEQLAALGLNPNASRHYCPEFMMEQGYWPTYQSEVEGIMTALTGTAPAPQGYAPIKKPAFCNAKDIAAARDITVVAKDGTKSTVFFCHRLNVVKKKTRRRQYASMAALAVGPDLGVGESFLSYWAVFSADKHWYVITEGGTRILADDLAVGMVFKGH